MAGRLATSIAWHGALGHLTRGVRQSRPKRSAEAAQFYLRLRLQTGPTSVLRSNVDPLLTLKTSLWWLATSPLDIRGPLCQHLRYSALSKPFVELAMSGVFISYRREDSQQLAGRLFDRLVQRFGKNRVFRDIDAIDPVGTCGRSSRSGPSRDAVPWLIGITAGSTPKTRRVDGASTLPTTS